MLLLTLFWPALAAGFLLGAVFGWLSGLPRTPASRLGAGGLGLAALVASGLAFAGIVPGRPGLWIEAGALVLGAYLVGALAGATIQAARIRRPAIG
ncbi:hypothetical protein G3T14_08345 [Methylobacterium sp. BTF04]|nr:hypothetical protein [Methylobacterium sp. BTF04]